MIFFLPPPLFPPYGLQEEEEKLGTDVMHTLPEIRTQGVKQRTAGAYASEGITPPPSSSSRCERPIRALSKKKTYKSVSLDQVELTWLASQVYDVYTHVSTRIRDNGWWSICQVSLCTNDTPRWPETSPRERRGSEPSGLTGLLRTSPVYPTIRLQLLHSTPGIDLQKSLSVFYSGVRTVWERKKTFSLLRLLRPGPIYSINWSNCPFLWSHSSTSKKVDPRGQHNIFVSLSSRLLWWFMLSEEGETLQSRETISMEEDGHKV